MTAAQFTPETDQERAARLKEQREQDARLILRREKKTMTYTTLIDRIAANPNPRRNVVSRALGAIWRALPAQRTLAALDREAAVDSARNVFAVLGAGAALAYMGTMPPYLVPVALVLIAGVWYGDYLRHF
jgi:hypothetical protein